MKKVNYKRVLILAIALIVVICITSCAQGKDENTENTTLSPVEDVTESGTFKDGEYLSPSPEETEKEIETEKETEAKPSVRSLKFISFGNGTCTVAGIGSCTDSCIVIPERSPDGDIVTSVEEMAFYGNTDIKAIQIPSTVTSIGSKAFGGCSSLVYISVDKNNKAFCDIDGILYSADKKTLILFPSSCGSASVELSSSLRAIADMAFYGCDELKTIYYSGSLADWGRLDIGEMNYGLYTASISCSDSGK